VGNQAGIFIIGMRRHIENSAQYIQLFDVVQDLSSAPLGCFLRIRDECRQKKKAGETKSSQDLFHGKRVNEQLKIIK
jgi:hypothetical protein